MNREARSVASKGRYGDDVLLHVNRRELEGIEQIVGRPLTYNPHTGLPEAFGWADAIPIVAGVAGTVLSGGNPLVGAAAAGAARTGVSASQGKDMGAALTDGLISGVTSYATAGVADAVAGAAPALAGAATDAGAQVAGDAVAQGSASTAASTAVPTAAATAAPPVAPPPGVTPLAASPSTVSPVEVPGGTMGSTPQAAAMSPTFGQPGPTPGLQGYVDGTQAAQGWDRMATRGDNIYRALSENPSGAASALARPGTLIAAGGTYAQMSGMFDPMRPRQRDPYDPSKHPERFPEARQATMPPTGFQAGMAPEWRYFARGGLADVPTRNVPSYGEAENVVAEARAAMLGEHPARNEAMSRLRDRMGPEAVRSVREEGGRVRGAGGGLDDLVPGTIEGRQRVRLADGEYVVSSDVVSALGDGSTDQGARKLTEMMNRVRKAKTGSSKQPGRIPRSVMPA